MTGRARQAKGDVGSGGDDDGGDGDGEGDAAKGGVTGERRRERECEMAIRVEGDV